MKPNDLDRLARNLGHPFKNSRLLARAVRHSSFVNEQPGRDLKDNERLEFLGDAVVNLVVGHLLMVHHPNLREGDLSRMRAGLVNEQHLAEIARAVGLGPHIRLGRGEYKTGGQEKDSILSDTLEAVVAAVYLDAGFDAAFAIISDRFLTAVQSVADPFGQRDFKTRLQERVQESRRRIPGYRVVDETGPDHEKTFRVELRVCGIIVQGSGKNKKAAEQDAARKALDRLPRNLAKR
jgi:ribonuclease III